MPLYAVTGKGVTDPVLLRVLAQERVDPMGVEFSQDYSVRALGKEHSPFAKFYRNLNGPEKWMVVSGLPMVDCDGDPCTPGWLAQGPSGRYVAKNNQYRALIQGKDVALTVRNDDPFGRKKGATLAYSPRLFVGGVEIPAAAPVLLPVDPWNPNYQQNVLEWDYGVCKRKLRTVEGRVHGYWVFPANPRGDVLIRYNQTGDYRLKLGPFRQNDDEEFIPASVFASASYPFEVSDSATYYPDAEPESASVDGWVYQSGAGLSWAQLVAEAGSNADPSATYHTLRWTDAASGWGGLYRIIYVFDTSGLPDTATISAATLSTYGESKVDEATAVTPDSNIYSSAPASNTNLVAGDYDSLGTTAFSTVITYANWSITGYNDFALNATGYGTISKTGVSKFGRRNANYDVAASAPTRTEDSSHGVNEWGSEKGTGYKPKLVVTYTAITDYPITAAHDKGYAPTVTREANFPRTASFAMGFDPSASRAAALARSPSHALGMEASASRATASARTAAHDLGLDPTVSRSWGRSRDASVDLGLEASASRVWGRAREAAVDFGMAVTVVRETAWGRTSDVAAGFAVTASRALGYGRTVSASLGYAVTAARSITVARTASVAMGLATSVTRGFAKIASVVMGFYTVADIRPRIKRRLGGVGTNRTVGSVGTNRDVEDAGTNRDVESW